MVNLVAGENKLDVSLIAIPPAVGLVSVQWDATPPFDTGSSHYWIITICNLVAFPVAYRLEILVNGAVQQGWNQTLASNQVVEYSQPNNFRTEGSYIFTFRIYYQDKLLDEISSTVSAKAPMTPANGVFVGGLAWWEPLTYWKSITDMPWPANVPITTSWSIQNIGGQSAVFRVEFMGRSGSVRLAPGEMTLLNQIQFDVISSSGSYVARLYADNTLVDSWMINVVIESVLTLSPGQNTSYTPSVFAFGPGASPKLPHAFGGKVTINGVPAPVGTTVIAKISGMMMAQYITGAVGYYGTGSVWLAVVGNIPEGTPIGFYVNGIYAGSYEWHSGWTSVGADIGA